MNCFKSQGVCFEYQCFLYVCMMNLYPKQKASCNDNLLRVMLPLLENSVDTCRHNFNPKLAMFLLRKS